MIDRNKTVLTHKVTRCVGLWLHLHGFKPVETEVDMPWSGGNEPGWVADLAGVIVPTQTELIDLKLLRRRPRVRYSPDPSRAGFYLGDRSEDLEAWDRERADLPRCMTCLVEVKTTRADFLGDRKWTAAPCTDLAWLAVVPGMVRADEWPAGWGVLEVTGEKVRQLRPPHLAANTLEHRFSVVYHIAVRRDHRTRYRLEREWRQRDRLAEAQIRARDVLHGVLQLAEAKRDSFEMDLAFSRLRSAKLRDDEIEALRELWQLGRTRRTEPKP